MSYVYCKIILERLLPPGALKMNVSMKIYSWMFESETLWRLILTYFGLLKVVFIHSTYLRLLQQKNNLMCSIHKQLPVNVSKCIFSYFKVQHVCSPNSPPHTTTPPVFLRQMIKLSSMFHANLNQVILESCKSLCSGGNPLHLGNFLC